MLISATQQVNFVDDLLRIEDKTGLTPLSDINGEVRAAGQQLINHFVRVQGLAVSQVRCTERSTGLAGLLAHRLRTCLGLMRALGNLKVCMVSWPV